MWNVPHGPHLFPMAARRPIGIFTHRLRNAAIAAYFVDFIMLKGWSFHSRCIIPWVRSGQVTLGLIDGFIGI